MEAAPKRLSRPPKSIYNVCMKTAKQGEVAYIRNSIRAYLDGTQTENWLIGVAGAVSPNVVREALAEHPNESRLAFLRELY